MVLGKQDLTEEEVNTQIYKEKEDLTVNLS